MTQGFAAVLIVLWAAFMIAALLWVGGDARKRGCSGAVVVLCVWTGPIGLLLWFLLRPALKTDAKGDRTDGR